MNTGLLASERDEVRTVRELIRYALRRGLWVSEVTSEFAPLLDS